MKRKNNKFNEKQQHKQFVMKQHSCLEIKKDQ